GAAGVDPQQSAHLFLLDLLLVEHADSETLAGRERPRLPGEIGRTEVVSRRVADVPGPGDGGRDRLRFAGCSGEIARPVTRRRNERDDAFRGGLPGLRFVALE